MGMSWRVSLAGNGNGNGSGNAGDEEGQPLACGPGICSTSPG